MQKLSLVVLRVGIGLVIIWFAKEQIFHPTSWAPYLPEFTKGLPISQTTFIYLNGGFELVFSILMVAGFYTRMVACLLALHMFGIVYTIGYNEISVRDFGIAVALASISLYGQSAWSLDEYLAKKQPSSNVITDATPR